MAWISSSQVSKLLLFLLFLLILFFLWMDYHLYLRIQNYSRDRPTGKNHTASSYTEATWFGCYVSPLCDITSKTLLLDHVNLYIYSPLVATVDKAFKVSDAPWISPNLISFSHMFVAFASGKCVASKNFTYRRFGVILFLIRSFLDDLDGHVARTRKHIRGQVSESGTSGFYIDGVCDALGSVALILGCYIFLRNNPPRRKYTQLPIDSKGAVTQSTYKTKVSIEELNRAMCCFLLQLTINAVMWNRCIVTYQYLLERDEVSEEERLRQNVAFQSELFYCVTWVWRIINVQNVFQFTLLAIFCNKIWEFLQAIAFMGFFVFFVAVCFSEMHILLIQKFIFA